MHKKAPAAFVAPCPWSRSPRSRRWPRPRPCSLLTENTGAHIAGDITAPTFTSNGGEACPVDGISGVSSITVRTDEGLPWCIESTEEEDTWRLRGGRCEEASRKVSFVLDTNTVLGTIPCTYEAAGLEGTITTEAEEDLDFQEQVSQGSPETVERAPRLSNSRAASH